MLNNDKYCLIYKTFIFLLKHARISKQAKLKFLDTIPVLFPDN